MLFRKIKLFGIKFLGLFIPYFKRMTKREKVLSTINQMMLGYANAGGYKLSQPTEIISVDNVHSIKYETRLSGGTFIIELQYKNGTVSHSFDQVYTKKFSNADYEELYKASKNFEEQINQSKLLEMFSQL